MRRIIDVWINCPSAAVADEIGAALISERLVACANRYPEIVSMYRWKGQIAHETEHPLLVKTRFELGDAVETRVAEIHPYDVPPILRVDISAANAAYIDWVFAETGKH